MIDALYQIDWQTFSRTLILAVASYLLIIFMIRLTGKRATSQLNNFDWIVTVAMGSLFASTIILEDISLTDGLLAILLLLSLQFILTKTLVHVPFMQRIFKAKPRLLLFEGKLLHDNMKRERILESEINSAIRENGKRCYADIYAVILETDAKMSVIPKVETAPTCEILSDVEGKPQKLIDELKAHQRRIDEMKTAKTD